MLLKKQKKKILLKKKIGYLENVLVKYSVLTLLFMYSIHSSSLESIGTKESLVTDNVGVFSFYIMKNH